MQGQPNLRKVSENSDEKFVLLPFVVFILFFFVRGLALGYDVRRFKYYQNPRVFTIKTYKQILPWKWPGSFRQAVVGCACGE